MPIYVTKRNGNKELLDIDKLHKVVEMACRDISGVSPSEVELNSQLQFFDGMKTSDIQETLIKSTADLITENTPNYQYVAGRLVAYQCKKEAYGTSEYPHLYDHVVKVVAAGFYTQELLEWYSKEEFEKLNDIIDHSRDDDFTYVGAEQFRQKYLVRNRVSGEIFETFQMSYILIAATFFHSYPKETRLKWVKDYYEALSKQLISLPTPIMSGLRTPQKQFSSCVTISSGDSLDSINATSTSIVKYVSQKAGLGINVGRIRAKGSPIRKGDTFHTGIIPFLRLFNAATKSCSQGSIRDGSATVFFPIWHREIQDLIVLKNNKGIESNRIRTMDYAVQINKLFYERLIENKDISLFCPNDVPELYDAFFVDNDKFKLLYEKAEADKNIQKKVVKAKDLFEAIMTERKETGRIYIMHTDNCNTHSAYIPELAPVIQNNLCMETAMCNTHMGEDNSLITLCTLAAVNWGKIDSPEDFKKPCELLVRSLDLLLSYQNYPVSEAKKSTDYYRPLGIGIINFAYWLAKNNLSYRGSKETYELVDEYTEAWSYYLIKASNDLAKEYGACGKNDHTRYSKGICPIDTYTKYVDKIVSRKPSMPWKELKENLKKYGIRNSVLMALMPAETSAQISNATNGIEPPRAYVSRKLSKSANPLPQVVPSYSRLKNKYQLLWDLESPTGYLEIVAILQKWIDQSISANTSYNPKFYKDEKIPMSILLKDLIKCYQMGIKTLYYFNTNNGVGDESLKETDAGCDSGACTI